MLDGQRSICPMGKFCGYQEVAGGVSFRGGGGVFRAVPFFAATAFQHTEAEGAFTVV